MFVPSVLFITIAIAITIVLPWLANNTNIVGKVYAKLFYWFQESCNLCLIRSKLPSIDATNKNVHTFIESYSKWFYFAMIFDKYRMSAYTKAIEKIKESKSAKSNWIDIGTGAHMPLSRLLLHNNVVNHAHAIEANTASYASAQEIKSRLMTKEEQNMVTLHCCYSTDLKSTVEPQPSAIIHEIVGTTASSEGAVSTLLDVLSRFPNINQLVPYRFGTLCVPVSRPSINIASSLASLVYGGAWSISQEAGIQCLYNPPQTWMSKPQLVENYSLLTLKEMVNSGSEVYENKVKIIINRRDFCCGLYLAPFIQCMPDGCEIDAMKDKTNWGVEFISFGSKSLWLEKDDCLEINFKASVENCPSYSLDVFYTDKSINIFSMKWKGPQDNMSIKLLT